MIVERTHYFAQPGLAEQVLAIRRRACAVRVAIGLPAGEIFRAAEVASEHPDVVWECAFADRAAHAADLAARAASPDFGTVRAQMTASIRSFQRHVFERDTAALANGMSQVALAGLPIVPREVNVPSSGRELKGYLFLPPGDGPFPCMIVNHGSGIDKGTLDVSRPGTAALLMSWGIASFLIHRHGYGNSPGPAWREDVASPFGTPAYDEELAARLDRESNDVLAALDQIAAMPQIATDHIGVIGSSFGGTNTLLAAAKTDRFRCAIDFAGAAMNWDRTPGLRALMTNAALKVSCPLFLIQAENDYSIRPTKELVASLASTGKTVWSRIYPAFGINAHEGHLLESRGAILWAQDVRHFLERYL